MDVDRTIVLPRGVADDEFNKIRKNAILDYARSFKLGELTNDEQLGIVRKIELISNRLIEYGDEDDNRLFKNEEVVAFGTLMSAIGCLNESWLHDQHPQFGLFTLLDWIHKQVSHCSWMCDASSGIGLGTNIWDGALLEAHIATVKEAYRTAKPVICELYREYEYVSLSRACKESNQFFNTPLLAALRSCRSTSVIYLSDRPGLSVGLSNDTRRLSTDDLSAFPVIDGLLAVTNID